MTVGGVDPVPLLIPRDMLRCATCDGQLVVGEIGDQVAYRCLQDPADAAMPAQVVERTVTTQLRDRLKSIARTVERIPPLDDWEALCVVDRRALIYTIIDRIIIAPGRTPEGVYVHWRHPADEPPDPRTTGPRPVLTAHPPGTAAPHHRLDRAPSPVPTLA